jgi:hypothetical protein
MRGLNEAEHPSGQGNLSGRLYCLLGNARSEVYRRREQAKRRDLQDRGPCKTVRIGQLV